MKKMKLIDSQLRTIRNQVGSPSFSVLVTLSLILQQGEIFEHLQYLMNGIQKIGGDDIDVPKRSSVDHHSVYE